MYPVYNKEFRIKTIEDLIEQNHKDFAFCYLNTPLMTDNYMRALALELWLSKVKEEVE